METIIFISSILVYFVAKKLFISKLDVTNIQIIESISNKLNKAIQKENEIKEKLENLRDKKSFSYNKFDNLSKYILRSVDKYIIEHRTLLDPETFEIFHHYIVKRPTQEYSEKPIKLGDYISIKDEDILDMIPQI